MGSCFGGSESGRRVRFEYLAHNMVLDVLNLYGLTGVALWLVIVVLLASVALKHWRMHDYPVMFSQAMAAVAFSISYSWPPFVWAIVGYAAARQTLTALGRQVSDDSRPTHDTLPRTIPGRFANRNQADQVRLRRPRVQSSGSPLLHRGGGLTSLHPKQAEPLLREI